jgi:hypothetical protein
MKKPTRYVSIVLCSVQPKRPNGIGTLPRQQLTLIPRTKAYASSAMRPLHCYCRKTVTNHGSILQVGTYAMMQSQAARILIRCPYAFTRGGIQYNKTDGTKAAKAWSDEGSITCFNALFDQVKEDHTVGENREFERNWMGSKCTCGGLCLCFFGVAPSSGCVLFQLGTQKQWPHDVSYMSFYTSLCWACTDPILASCHSYVILYP